MDSPNQWNLHQWGRSKHLHMTETVDLAIAEGKAGGESSWHLHERKDNWFLVIDGIVTIMTSTEDSPLMEHALSDGDAFCVPAGRKHRMAFASDAVLYELYTPANGGPVDLADIVRFDQGKRPTKDEVICG